MNRIFAASLVLLPILFGPVRNTHAQAYRFSSDVPGVWSGNKALVFHRVTRLNLLALYSPPPDIVYDAEGKADLSGEMSYIKGVQTRSDGYVEIRIYDYDENAGKRGNFIYGARSRATGKNVALEAWDASTEFKHWDRLRVSRTFISSTNIKFLSQFEKLGSICYPKPGKETDYASYMYAAAHGLMAFTQGLTALQLAGYDLVALAEFFATTALVFGIPISTYLIASQFASELKKIDEISLLLDEQPRTRDVTPTSKVRDAIRDWSLRYQHISSGEWCDIVMPAPVVLVEVEVKNFLFHKAKIFGIPEFISGTQLFERDADALPLPEGCRAIDLADIKPHDKVTISNYHSIIATTAVNWSIPGFEMPHLIALPHFDSSYVIAHEQVFEIPETGRLMVVGERERMKLLPYLTKELGVKATPLGTDVMRVEFAGVDEPLIYDAYSLIAYPGAEFNLAVGPEGPFVIHYGFLTTSDRELPGQRANTATDSTTQTHLAGAFDWRIHPNPVHGDLTIYFETPRSMTTNVKLINQMNATVYESELMLTAGAQSHSIQTMHLPSGLYFLHVNTPQHQGAVRVFIH